MKLFRAGQRVPRDVRAVLRSARVRAGGPGLSCGPTDVSGSLAAGAGASISADAATFSTADNPPPVAGQRARLRLLSGGTVTVWIGTHVQADINDEPADYDGSYWHVFAVQPWDASEPTLAAAPMVSHNPEWW